MSWLQLLLEKNSSDPRERLELGQELVDNLQTQRLPSDSRILNDFCDLTFQWLAASNFKVTLKAVEMLDVAVSVSGDLIAPYLIERLTALIERLGDSKPTVRDATEDLLFTMAGVPHCSPQMVLEKLTPAFTHRNWMVRTGAMNVFRSVLEKYQLEVEIQVNRLIPTFCKLMSDPNSEVRECSASTLAHIMNVLGPDVAKSIRNRQLIPDSKLAMVAARCEEALRNSPVARSPRSASTAATSRLPMSRVSMNGRPRNGSVTGDPEQENRMSATRNPNVRTPSVPAVKRVGTAMSAASTLSKGAGSAGSVGEADFRTAFDSVSKVTILDARDLTAQLDKCSETLQNMTLDWDKRCQALKTIRALGIHGGLDEFKETYISAIANMEVGLCESVKDLRSSICKEACITLCYLCEKLGMKMAKLCETLLQPLIVLCQNSAKVMATSGAVTCIFITRYVQSPKLIPIIINNQSSKSKEIRRNVQELLIILLGWETSKLDKHLSAIMDTIKSGLGDADPQARTFARTGYGLLEQAFPNQAKFLFQSLDPSKQKALAGHMSASSSSTSIATDRDGMPIGGKPGMGMINRNYMNGRSASAIDPTAAKRALTTPSKRFGVAPFSGSARKNAPLSSGYGMMGPPRSVLTSKQPTNQGYVSQPGSRSGSPTRSPNGWSSVSRATGAAFNNKPPFAVRARTASREPSPRRDSRGSNGRQFGGVPSDVLGTRIESEFFTNQDGDNAFFAPTPRTSHTPGNDLSFDGVKLEHALRMCGSSQINERRDGLRIICEYAQMKKPVGERELKGILDALMKLFSESNQKLMTVLMETIKTVFQSYSEQMDSKNSMFAVIKFIQKYAGEVIPTVRSQLRETLKDISLCLDPQTQLVAVSRNLTDPIMMPGDRVKMRMIEFMIQLLERDAAFELNRAEIRKALNSMFMWKDDMKHAQLVPMIEKLICKMFEASSADFSCVLTTFDPIYREYAHGLLKKHNPVLGNGKDVTDSPGAGTGGSIREMSQQIEEFVRVKTSSPLRSTPLARNMTTSSPAYSHNSPANKAVAAHPVVSSPTPVHGNYSPLGDSDEFSVLDSTMYLARDLEKQREHLDELVNTLAKEHLDVARRAQQKQALSSLYQMIGEGSFTLWDDFFRRVLLRIFDVMEVNDCGLNKMAIKLLSKICLVQAARLYEVGEMVILKLLEVTVDEVDAQVSQAADEAAKVLATHLPTPTVVRALNSIIANQTAASYDPKLSGALKMMTHFLNGLEENEMLPLLVDIVPGLVKSFHNESSSAVRKSAVFSIVAINNKVGKGPLESYISGMPPNKSKLLDVYIQRAKTSSTNFA